MYIMVVPVVNDNGEGLNEMCTAREFVIKIPISGRLHKTLN